MMKHLKGYKLFESVDSDLEEIKDIMNDISDMEDNIGVYIDMVRDVTITGFGDDRKIKINIFPTKGEFFKINQNIKSTIQRLNHLYKNDYYFLHQYMNGYKWIKFYVYDDERGLRDYDTVKMDGSGKFPAPKIYKMQIVMSKR
jgi:hypothetical protein